MLWVVCARLTRQRVNRTSDVVTVVARHTRIAHTQPGRVAKVAEITDFRIVQPTGVAIVAKRARDAGVAVAGASVRVECGDGTAYIVPHTADITVAARLAR